MVVFIIPFIVSLCSSLYSSRVVYEITNLRDTTQVILVPK